MLRDHGVTTLRVDVAELGSELEAAADELADLLLARSAALTASGSRVIKVHPARMPLPQDAP